MTLKNPVRAFWQRHRALSIAFLAASILTLAFALKTVLAVYYWHNPAHRELELKGWMTLGHVAMIHNIPVRELAKALDLDPQYSRRLPLWQITRERGETLKELEDQIAEALDDHERTGDDE